jgi:hypothetical protein
MFIDQKPIHETLDCRLSYIHSKWIYFLRISEVMHAKSHHVNTMNTVSIIGSIVRVIVNGHFSVNIAINVRRQCSFIVLLDIFLCVFFFSLDSCSTCNIRSNKSSYDFIFIGHNESIAFFQYTRIQWHTFRTLLID